MWSYKYPVLLFTWSPTPFNSISPKTSSHWGHQRHLGEAILSLDSSVGNASFWWVKSGTLSPDSVAWSPGVKDELPWWFHSALEWNLACYCQSPGQRAVCSRPTGLGRGTLDLGTKQTSAQRGKGALHPESSPQTSSPPRPHIRPPPSLQVWFYQIPEGNQGGQSRIELTLFSDDYNSEFPGPVPSTYI